MDPTACYLEMCEAMKSGDHETARERAMTLDDWFRRGGFAPPNYAPSEVKAYLQSVLRRTAYLDLRF